VRLVISDAHEGLKGAIGAVLLGAAWQRCRVHFLRNLLWNNQRLHSACADVPSAEYEAAYHAGLGATGVAA
jgi:transposase-like protein